MWSLSLPSLVSLVSITNSEAEAQNVTPVDDVPLKRTTYVDPHTYPSFAEGMKQVGVKEIPCDELSKLDEIGCGEPWFYSLKYNSGNYLNDFLFHFMLISLLILSRWGQCH